MDGARATLLLVLLAVVTTAKDIITVRKCCAAGEYISDNGTSCVRFAARKIENVSEEFFDPCANREKSYWLPKPLSIQKIFVKYSRAYFKNGSFVINAEDKSMWNLSEPDGESLSFRVVLPFSQMIELSTSAFCFDAMAKGSEHQLVIYAVLPELRKCCRKGEQLNEKAERCEARPGSKVEDIENEIFVASLNDNDTYWLPKQLHRNSFVAHYRDTHPFHDRIVLAAEDSVTWKTDPSLNVIVLNETFAEGISRIDFTQIFCFDAIREGCLPSKALLAVFQPNNNTHSIRKCCPAGHVLSAQRRCMRHRGADWELLNSKAVPAASDTYGEEIISNYDSIHPETSCKIIYSSSEKEAFRQKMFHTINSKFSPNTIYCADFLRGKNDDTREALAVCKTVTIPFYERVRPLSVVPAVMLAAGLAVLLHREETRNTMHGRVLVCHTTSLFVANTLQAVWFFKHPFAAAMGCDTNYAYTIYFFLISAGLWLNVVSLNMAVGFRSVSRVRALRNGGGAGGDGAGWRRFGLLCLVAWGVAGALTAFSVCIHRSARGPDASSLTPPSFFETKACFPEAFVDEATNGDDMYRQSRMGTLYYFYVPMGIMALVNAICLVLTTLRIRDLSRESSRVEKARTSVNLADRCVPRGVQNAVLYVKLLLTAGVLELLAEGCAWAAWALGGAAGGPASDADAASGAGFFSQETAFVFVTVGTFVDVARAAAVWWLCCGRWCGFDFVGCWLVETLARLRRRREERGGGGGERKAGPDVISNARPPQQLPPQPQAVKGEPPAETVDNGVTTRL